MRFWQLNNGAVKKLQISQRQVQANENYSGVELHGLCMLKICRRNFSALWEVYVVNSIGFNKYFIIPG